MTTRATGCLWLLSIMAPSCGVNSVTSGRPPVPDGGPALFADSATPRHLNDDDAAAPGDRDR